MSIDDDDKKYLTLFYLYLIIMCYYLIVNENLCNLCLSLFNMFFMMNMPMRLGRRSVNKRNIKTMTKQE